MRRRYQVILSAAFFGLLLIYAGALFIQSTVALSRHSEPGWVPYQIGGQLFVGHRVSPEAAGLLRPDDEVLAINNMPVASDFDIAEAFRRIEPATGYLMKLRRAGRTADLMLPAQPIPTSTWVVSIASRIIIPNLFLLTGLVVFLLKPKD